MDPDQVTLKISQRDPSTARGMTVIVGKRRQQ